MAIPITTWGPDGHEHDWGPIPEPIDDPVMAAEKDKWQKCIYCAERRYNPIQEMPMESFEHD